MRILVDDPQVLTTRVDRVRAALGGRGARDPDRST